MQTRKEDNAFPVFDKDGLVLAKDDQYSWEGLSKREYFAALAMQGILANPEFMSTMAAKVAVKKADELIEELNRTGSNVTT